MCGAVRMLPQAHLGPSDGLLHGWRERCRRLVGLYRVWARHRVGLLRRSATCMYGVNSHAVGAHHVHYGVQHVFSNAHSCFAASLLFVSTHRARECNRQRCEHLTHSFSPSSGGDFNMTGHNKRGACHALQRKLKCSQHFTNAQLLSSSRPGARTDQLRTAEARAHPARVGTPHQFHQRSAPCAPKKTALTPLSSPGPAQSPSASAVSLRLT